MARALRIMMAVAAVVLLLLGVSGSGIDQVQVAPHNPAFVDFTQKMALGTWRHFTEEGYPLGHIPSPADRRHLKQQPVGATAGAVASKPAAAAVASSLPSSFDWRTSCVVTPVKDQGTCGDCWAFGNLGALEAKYMMAQPNPCTSAPLDLSENNMASCHWPWLWGRCQGGNTSVALAYLAGLVKYSTLEMFQKGALLESVDPYSDTNHNATLCTNTGRPDPFLRIEGARWVAQNDALMKAAIYNNGPMVTDIYWQDSKYNPNTYIYYYPGCTKSTNHEVVIVGWDDTMANPGGQGCWIVKNSWGTDWGDSGYFYVAYGSGNIGSSDNLYYVGTRPFSANENFYLEDLPGWIYSLGFRTNTAYGATVFSVLNSTETLTHVDFFTTANNAQYEIKVWSTVSKTTNITFSGQLGTTQTGTCQEAGYYSIPLTTTVPLTGGRNYGVQVKFYTPGYNYPLPCAAPIGGVVGQFAGQGNATSYGSASASGPFQRLVSGRTTYVPCIRVRTLH
jgi:C1A family cysteine protease